MPPPPLHLSVFTPSLCWPCAKLLWVPPGVATTSRRKATRPIRTGALAFSSSTSARGEPTTASTSETKNLYPFPYRKNPSPHEIFHLPRNATEADIKARYFDLVRLYHPDKATDLPAEAAHSRFRSITSAYDILRGKKASGSADEEGVGNANVDLRYQTTAAWRAAHRKRQQELYSSGAADEKWKDRIILFGVVSTVVFVVLNTFTTRKEAMAEALSRTRQVNEYRFQERREQEQALLKKQQQQARMEEEARLSADS